MAKKRKSDSSMLASVIVEGIKNKKGDNIALIDLRKIHNAVADYFVVCHANSSVQVNAIAESVEMETKKVLNEKSWKKEGYENAEWVLLDYVTVVVHVFQQETRNYYKLEELWGDADINYVA